MLYFFEIKKLGGIISKSGKKSDLPLLLIGLSGGYN